MTARWYIIHVYSGFEKKVMTSIREQAIQKGLADQFEEIMVPMEEVVEALQAVTADDLQALAGRLFRDEVLCGAVIGPDLKSDNLEGALRLP